MAELPIPADILFRDFSHDVKRYNIIRSGNVVVSVDGLPNDEDDGAYVFFPISSDIQGGDIIQIGGENLIVSRISTDTYRGTPALIRAFY